MEPMKTVSFLAALFTSAALAAPVAAQARTTAPPTEKPGPPVMTPEDIKAQYTKYEYRIAMRDGKKLFTAVYVPKDDSQAYPILMTRTPYSCRPYGVDQYKTDLGPSVHFSKAAYIFVYQDVRGRWMSEGEHVNMRPHNPKKGPQDIDESTDTYDTINWLVKHVPNNNGRVGLWGISYPGFYTAAGMIEAHPALKAASPQAPIVDWFVGDDWHHNGALMLPHVFNFMANFGRPRPEPIKKSPYLPFDHDTPDGYAFFLKMGPLANADNRYFKGDVAFWNEVMKHGTYDEFWRARNLRPHLKNIKPAVMSVGGWFDAENLFGALETFKSVERAGPGTTNLLVMGPWLHGGWQGGRGDGDSLGHVSFNAKTAEFYREKIELPFFEYHLKGTGDFKHPKAWVFETGTNQWRKYESWPPKSVQAKPLYFGKGNVLSGKAPDNDGEAFDEYVSDPAKPVPFVDKIGIGMLAEYMVGDQRMAARRPDVLSYETDVLPEDVTIAGPIQVDLFVSTTGTDTDWVVKVIDVYPDDYPDPKPNPSGVRMGAFQQLVRGDVMRGKFRNSFEKPEPFSPGKPTPVKFAVPDTLHTFRAGHRIMVQVQSSWFPLVDRNPQTFLDIYAAKEADFQKATQRVYRSKDMASRITVLVRP
jgi:putative CocE/NonD family hydrolase